MKLSLLLFLPLSLVAAAGAPIQDTVDRLPQVRAKALSETSELRAGNTTEMADAASIIQDRLLPSIVVLEAKLRDQAEAVVRERIERDLEAIARDAQIRGHADGWGGTLVTVDAAWAIVAHLEARASWCVWQLMEDDADFDFSAWKQRWKADPESGGAEPSPTASDPTPENPPSPGPEPEAPRP